MGRVPFAVLPKPALISRAASPATAQKSPAFSEAPPIRPPSISGCAEQLRGVLSVHRAAVKDAHASATPGGTSPVQLGLGHRVHFLGLRRRGVRPVPIAQTGS